jgi:hypothetical protein
LEIFSSRVHITQATLDHLAGLYEVEPGPGLREHNVASYFIVPPPGRKKSSVFSSLSVSKRNHHPLIYM